MEHLAPGADAGARCLTRQWRNARVEFGGLDSQWRCSRSSRTDARRALIGPWIQISPRLRKKLGYLLLKTYSDLINPERIVTSLLRVRGVIPGAQAPTKQDNSPASPRPATMRGMRDARFGASGRENICPRTESSLRCAKTFHVSPRSGRIMRGGQTPSTTCLRYGALRGEKQSAVGG